MAGPACSQCENTEYEELEGHFYCTLCKQISQELGAVRVVEEGVRNDQTGYTKSLSISSRGKKEPSRKKRCYERWNTAEGWSYILAGWINQLEQMGFDGIRTPVLDVWALYLRRLGVAFTPAQARGESDDKTRSVSSMSVRDRWNFFGGPPKMLTNYNAKRLLSSKQRAIKRKRLEKSSNDEDDDEEALDVREASKKRSKKKRAFYKSFSESLIEESNDVSEKSSQKITSSEAYSGSASEVESNSTLFEDAKIEQLCDIASLVSESSRKCEDSAYITNRKLPVNINLKYLRAVLTLALTCVPGTVVSSSDLAYMFSSEMLANITSIQFLPQSFHTVMHEIRSFSALESSQGVRFIRDAILREDALTLASFIQLTRRNRELILCTKKTFEDILGRYIEDLCLPSFLTEDIMRALSKCSLMTITCQIPEYRPGIGYRRRHVLPSVAARILAVILISLKYHCGLDGEQEYYYNHIAEQLNSQASEKQTFDILSWIRLSKLRLDYLISNDSTSREQYRSFRNAGTPMTTLKSMEEIRGVLENSDRPIQTPLDAFSHMKEIVADHASYTDLSRRPLQNMKTLQEKTRILMEENDSKELRAKLEKLLSMPDYCMKMHYEESSCDIPHYNKFKHKLMKPHKSFKIGKTLRSSVVDKMKAASKLEMSQEKPVCPWNLNPGILPVFKKQYWFSAINLPANKEYCDSDLLSCLQCLPNNYLWILQYFGAYGLIPLQLIESEVVQIELYLKKIDPSFFSVKIRKSEVESDCDCDECEEHYINFPKNSERFT